MVCTGAWEVTAVCELGLSNRNPGSCQGRVTTVGYLTLWAGFGHILKESAKHLLSSHWYHQNLGEEAGYKGETMGTREGKEPFI